MLPAFPELVPPAAYAGNLGTSGGLWLPGASGGPAAGFLDVPLRRLHEPQLARVIRGPHPPSRPVWFNRALRPEMLPPEPPVLSPHETLFEAARDAPVDAEPEDARVRLESLALAFPSLAGQIPPDQHQEVLRLEAFRPETFGGSSAAFPSAGEDLAGAEDGQELGSAASADDSDDESLAAAVPHRSPWSWESGTLVQSFKLAGDPGPPLVLAVAGPLMNELIVWRTAAESGNRGPEDPRESPETARPATQDGPLRLERVAMLDLNQTITSVRCGLQVRPGLPFLIACATNQGVVLVQLHPPQGPPEPNPWTLRLLFEYPTPVPVLAVCAPHPAFPTEVAAVLADRSIRLFLWSVPTQAADVTHIRWLDYGRQADTASDPAEPTGESDTATSSVVSSETEITESSESAGVESALVKEETAAEAEPPRRGSHDAADEADGGAMVDDAPDVVEVIDIEEDVDSDGGDGGTASGTVLSLLESSTDTIQLEAEDDPLGDGDAGAADHSPPPSSSSLSPSSSSASVSMLQSATLDPMADLGSLVEAAAAAASAQGGSGMLSSAGDRADKADHNEDGESDSLAELDSSSDELMELPDDGDDDDGLEEEKERQPQDAHDEDVAAPQSPRGSSAQDAPSPTPTDEPTPTPTPTTVLSASLTTGLPESTPLAAPPAADWAELMYGMHPRSLLVMFREQLLSVNLLAFRNPDLCLCHRMRLPPDLILPTEVGASDNRRPAPPAALPEGLYGMSRARDVPQRVMIATARHLTLIDLRAPHLALLQWSLDPAEEPWSRFEFLSLRVRLPDLQAPPPRPGSSASQNARVQSEALDKLRETWLCLVMGAPAGSRSLRLLGAASWAPTRGQRSLPPFSLGPALDLPCVRLHWPEHNLQPQHQSRISGIAGVSTASGSACVFVVNQHGDLTLQPLLIEGVIPDDEGRASANPGDAAAASASSSSSLLVETPSARVPPVLQRFALEPAVQMFSVADFTAAFGALADPAETREFLLQFEAADVVLGAQEREFDGLAPVHSPEVLAQAREFLRGLGEPRLQELAMLRPPMPASTLEALRLLAQADPACQRCAQSPAEVVAALAAYEAQLLAELERKPMNLRQLVLWLAENADLELLDPEPESVQESGPASTATPGAAANANPNRLDSWSPPEHPSRVLGSTEGASRFTLAQLVAMALGQRLRDLEQQPRQPPQQQAQGQSHARRRLHWHRTQTLPCHAPGDCPDGCRELAERVCRCSLASLDARTATAQHPSGAKQRTASSRGCSGGASGGGSLVPVPCGLDTCPHLHGGLFYAHTTVVRHEQLVAHYRAFLRAVDGEQRAALRRARTMQRRQRRVRRERMQIEGSFLQEEDTDSESSDLFGSDFSDHFMPMRRRLGGQQPLSEDDSDGNLLDFPQTDDEDVLGGGHRGMGGLGDLSGLLDESGLQEEGAGEEPDNDMGPLDLTQDLDGLMALTQQLDEEEQDGDGLADVQSRVDRYMMEGQQRLVGQAAHDSDGRVDLQAIMDENEAIWQ